MENATECGLKLFCNTKSTEFKVSFLQWFECRCLVSAIDLRLALLGCINCGLRRHSVYLHPVVCLLNYFVDNDANFVTVSCG